MLDIGTQWILYLCNGIVKEGSIPEDWKSSVVLPIYKGKGVWILHTHTHIPFNGLFSRKTWVSRYQKGKTSLDLNEARYDGVLECSGIS